VVFSFAKVQKDIYINFTITIIMNQIKTPTWIQEKYIAELEAEKIQPITTIFENIGFDIAQSSEYIANFLDKPPEKMSKIPEDKIGSTMLAKVRKDFISLQKAEQILSPEDMLICIYPELNLTQKESIEIYNFLKLDKLEDNNPTNILIVKYLAECMRAGEAVDLTMSVCIGITSELRSDNIKSKFGLELSGTDKFYTKIEVNRLDEIVEAIRKSDLEFNINFRLGDMDWKNLIDTCYGSMGSQSADYELTLAMQNFIEGIKEKYPDINFKVEKWSDFYNYNKLTNSFDAANQSSAQWLKPDFKKQCRYLYLNSWGYGDIFKDLWLDQDEMDKFIEQDIIKTAGQYRLESEFANGISVWAQGYGKSSWPLQMTNYNNAGLPPSISIVPNN
jgi:hypothetical protein